MIFGDARFVIRTVASCEGGAVLRLNGELDHAHERSYREALGAVVDAGRRYVVLDVSALSFCDSRGLNCLLGTHWLLQRQGGDVLLAGAGRRLTALLAQTGSEKLLACYASVTQALREIPEEFRPDWPPQDACTSIQ